MSLLRSGNTEALALLLEWGPKYPSEDSWLKQLTVTLCSFKECVRLSPNTGGQTWQKKGYLEDWALVHEPPCLHPEPWIAPVSSVGSRGAVGLSAHPLSLTEGALCCHPLCWAFIGTKQQRVLSQPTSVPERPVPAVCGVYSSGWTPQAVLSPSHYM